VAGEGRPAVFLDRDGTLIVDRHYLSDPAGVELLPGAAEAVARLSAAGLFTALVTNQSGIGRGYFTEAEYHCPLGPGEPDPQECRKPRPGMYLRAAREHGLDLARSWYVGDRLRDVIMTQRLGGRAVLVKSPESELEEALALPFITVVDSLAEAADVVLSDLRGTGA
jgi:HAD superfamily hydrolase (TIGR01662 family)